MAAVADRLTVAGPRPKELWLTLGLSIVLHGLLVAVVILMPRFRLGTYVNVPVSYTVDLVSATPGGRAAGSAPAKAPSAPAKAPAAPAPRPAPPVVAPRVAPPAPPAPAARSSEELTLPGKRPARKAPEEVEPSLRPPPQGRERQRRVPRKAVESNSPAGTVARGAAGRRSVTTSAWSTTRSARTGTRWRPALRRTTSLSFVSESCPRGMSGTWSLKRARGTPGWTTRRCAPFGRVCLCRRSPTS
jgi:hypothetical protein